MQPIHDILHTLAGRWFKRQAGLYAAILEATLLLWLLVVIVLDNILMLPAVALLAAWAVLVTALSLCLAALLQRTVLDKPSPRRLALLYENAVPGHRNRLINAVEMLDSPRLPHDPMVAAVVLENASRLDATAPDRAINFTLVRKVLAVAIAIALALVLYAAVRPAWAFNALARLLHPLSPPAHLQDLSPTAKPGNVLLVAGDPLDIDGQLRADLSPGHAPESITLEYQSGDGQWMSQPLTRNNANPRAATVRERTITAETAAPRYRHRFEAVWNAMNYRLRAGRGVSPVYHVTVRARPALAGIAVTTTAPEYAGAEVTTLKADVGDIRALAGSKVEVGIVATAPLSSAALRFSDGTTTALHIDRAEPTHARGQFTLTRDGSYTVELTDDSPERLASLNTARYALVAVPDEAPQPLVVKPGRDMVLPIDTVLPLTIAAGDDIGLASLAIELRKGGGPWMVVETWPVKERGVRTRTLETTLDLPALNRKRDLQLKPGDTLLYRAVATDYRLPDANTGIGHTWSLVLATPAGDASLLRQQTAELLEALKEILALQKEARLALDMDQLQLGPQATLPQGADRALLPAQQHIRQLTVTLADRQRKVLRPPVKTITELTALADGPMLKLVQRLADFRGDYQQRLARKAPLLALEDDIIRRLEALIGLAQRSLSVADAAAQAISQLPPEQREQALANIRDMLTRLRDFTADQDKVIADTEELARKADNFTDAELQKIEALKGTEDQWAKVFAAGVEDIKKLTEQGFADRSIANDYKEMVEQIEAAAMKLDQKLVTMAVPRELSGRELATSLAEDMEMWLPPGADNVKWVMEEPADFPEIPMPELPDQLSDLIGDLMEQEEALMEEADDVTSSWADSMSAAGWGVSDGPISNFSAKGKTGNQMPNNNEVSGRSGDGRSGRSQGQMVEDTAKGLKGRDTPTRLTNDAYEQGVVKELQQMATGGATGGGKARGQGQDGLQGGNAPPNYKDMMLMRDWQQKIRNQTEQVAGQLKSVRIAVPELDAAAGTMKEAESAAEDGRYQDMLKKQKMVLGQLEMARDVVSHDVTMRVDRAYAAPPGARANVLDAADEPVPAEYRDAVRRYFEQLSE